jgi:hypothetical protein
VRLLLLQQTFQQQQQQQEQQQQQSWDARHACGQQQQPALPLRLADLLLQRGCQNHQHFP